MEIVLYKNNCYFILLVPLLSSWNLKIEKLKINPVSVKDVIQDHQNDNFNLNPSLLNKKR